MLNTIQYYNENTPLYIAQTQHVDTTFLLNRLIDGIPKNSHVLDLGCGSGRDALFMQKNNLNVTAIDASHNLINHLKTTSSLNAIESSFESYQPKQPYQLIYAIASLLHLKKDDFIKMIKKYSELLTKDGQFFFCVKMGDGEETDDKGLFFTHYQIEDIKQIFKELNLPKPFITISSDGVGRDTKWINVTHKNNANLLNNSEKDMISVSEWMNTSIDNVLFEPTKTPIKNLLKQITEMQSTYQEYPNDHKRTNKIIKLLQQGSNVFPIYVMKDDPSNFVMEGRHRMVAFKEIGMTEIPTIKVSLLNQLTPTKKLNPKKL